MMHSPQHAGREVYSLVTHVAAPVSRTEPYKRAPVSVKWKRPVFAGTELRQRLRAAERVLRMSDPESFDRDVAVSVINDWRISHQFPLNTFQQTLRSRARSVERSPVVVQRIKKMETIQSKIHRVDKLELWDMQDVGGCRAIMSSIDAVRELESRYVSQPMRHRLKRRKDYIAIPKEDGYRGIHLIYVYQHTYEDQAPWTGCQIEIQLRTKLQHAWAAAIETADLFDEQDLKFGGGKPEWRRFFLLMSAYLALRENCPPVVGVPAEYDQLCAEIRSLEASLHIRKKLSLWSRVTKHFTASRSVKDAQFFVLNLNIDNPDKASISFAAFGNKRDNQEAQARAAVAAGKKLLEEEAVRGGKRSVVLVGARSLNGMKAAFPAYFADTAVFMSELERALSGNRKSTL